MIEHPLAVALRNEPTSLATVAAREIERLTRENEKLKTLNTALIIEQLREENKILRQELDEMWKNYQSKPPTVYKDQRWRDPFSRIR